MLLTSWPTGSAGWTCSSTTPAPVRQLLALELTLDQWRTVIATDLDGPFVCLQRSARRMVNGGNGGRLIAITSVHEHQPRVGSAPYDAAKHGLGGLMKTLALELGEFGITANSVARGEIPTPDDRA